MREMIAKHIALKAWGVFIVANALAVWGWSKLETDLSNTYRLFPLFGLIGFSTMWGHYVVWALREYSGADPAKTALYSQITQRLVLVSILLHPALLIYQLNADELGLPPGSYEAYVGSALVGYVILGMVCLFAFLAFEFKKYLQKNESVWKAVMVANHLAMIGIVIHALKVGSSMKQAPLKYVWPIYGLSLIAIYTYLANKKKLV